jgi:cold shock CspA family protein
METQTGVIVRLHNDRGYGFIRGDDGVYYFFHRVGVVSPTFEELREGHPVEFLSVKGRKGKPRAIGVVVT